MNKNKMCITHHLLFHSYIKKCNKFNSMILNILETLKIHNLFMLYNVFVSRFVITYTHLSRKCMPRTLWSPADQTNETDGGLPDL